MIYLTQGDMLDTKPQANELHYLVHSCNDRMVMGSGIAKKIADKWPVVYENYRKWHGARLGDVQLVRVEPNKVVVNLIGQKDYGGMRIGNYIIPNVRYDSIYEGFIRLRANIEKFDDDFTRVINLCLMGCSLGGGDMKSFGETVNKAFKNYNFDIPVVVWAYTEEELDFLSTNFDWSVL